MKLSSEFISGVVVGTITALIGAVFGLGLTIAWDSWKQKTQHAEEYQRAVQLLKSEVATNIKILETTKEYLNVDIKAAEAKQEVVGPLITLSSRAWETVYLAGTFSVREPKLSDQFKETYALVEILNQKIQSRQLYRNTNAAMPNFPKRRKIIDENLLEDVGNLLPRFKEHQQFLTDK